MTRYWYLRLLCSVVLVSAPAAIQAQTLRLTPTQEQTRADLEKTSLQYFLDNANPVSGLVRDKANSFTATAPDENTEASLASTGFGLTVISHASTRGLVTRAFALNYYNKVMRFARDNLDRNHGFFLHWVDWRTGKIVWAEDNGFSSLDTSFFIAGALYGAQLFPDSEGAKIAHQMYRDMDFYWLMTDDGKFPDRRTLSLGYRDGEGFNFYQLSIYAEQQLLVMLGLGHPTAPLPVEAWHAWERREFIDGPFRGTALDMPLFIHQYSQAFIDFRGFRDRYPNYYSISTLATAYNKYIANLDVRHSTTRFGFWGFSAGQAPGQLRQVYHSQKNLYVKYEEDYAVYEPRWNHAGVVCISCAPGSAMFLPEVVFNDTEAWRKGPYGPMIWGRYGFTDSIDIDQDWYSKKSLGITVGTTYLSVANTRQETSVWSVFNHIPEIKKAMDRIRE